MKFECVEVSEKELEDMIRQAPHMIEDGLQYITHQKKTNRGSLDILFVDSGNSLVVAELKVVEDDTMLIQGLDYYNDVSNNIELLARAYSKFKINPEQDVRLLLIAPSFSILFLNRCRWLDIPVSVFSYRCIQLEKTAEKVPVFNEVTIPFVPVIEKPYLLEDRFNYIVNKESRHTAKKFLDEVRSWDTSNISSDAIKYAISVKFRGTVLCYLSPRRKSFYIGAYNPEGEWTSFPVNNKEDLENIRVLLKANIEKLG